MTRTTYRLLLVGAFAACTPDRTPEPSTPSSFDREVQGGRFHRAPVAPFTAEEPVDPSLLLQSHADLTEVLGPLGPSDFEVTWHRAQATPAGRRLVHVNLQQEVDGVPIRGAFLHLTLRPTDSSGDA
ncbi:MAG TPA: hypothetical protein VFW03_16435, partial [Gemmatimonadaceae bacterium]|nr:hypothetical protein [Gemmatimonadaceae bacterium]